MGEKTKKKGSISYAKWGYIFIAPFFLIFAVFQLIPLASTIYYSFFEYYRSGLKIIGPNFVGLKNYVTLFATDLPKYFSNTLLLWIIGFIPQIAISLLLAAWFTDLRLKLKGQTFFKTVIYMPNLIMASAFAMLFFALFSDNGPVNAALMGMSILKLPYPPLVATIVGVTNVIPFFGPFIGAVPATLLILIQSPIKALWFVLFVLVLQQLDGNVIGPKILGNTTGLSSFWVLFAILLFGGLWGFVGMIIGVPLFAVIYDVLKKFVFHGLRRNGQLDQMPVYHDEFGDPGDPAPAPVEDEGTETEIVIDSGEE